MKLRNSAEVEFSYRKVEPNFEGVKIMNGIKDREQALEMLRDLMDHGYKYVVRDVGSEYLSCFTLRPKKYMDTGWGYVNADDPGARMVYPIRNIDITEINHTNRSAVLVTVLLER